MQDLLVTLFFSWLIWATSSSALQEDTVCYTNMMKQLLVIGTIIILAAGIILGTSLMATTVYAQQSAAPQNLTNNASTTTVTNTTAAGGAAVTNATATTGTIITNLTWFDGQVDQLSPENIQYQHTDPAFANLAQTTADCLNDLNKIYAKVEANPQFSESPGSATAYTPGDIQGQDQCTDVINQGVAQFCESTDSATFDSQKCQEARLMTDDYVAFAEALFE